MNKQECFIELEFNNYEFDPKVEQMITHLQDVTFF
jgi:hypothetical protein